MPSMTKQATPHQLLAPICTFCQIPLFGGRVAEVSVLESLRPPVEIYQVNTVSLIKCGQCQVVHKVFLGTSLQECRLMVSPFEAGSVEEGVTAHNKKSISDEEVVDAIELINSRGFRKALAGSLKRA